MRLVSVSLKALYDKFGGDLNSGEIIKEVDGDNEYYDLETNSGIVCMDGETCKVIDSGDFGYELLNTEGESDRVFFLTQEEFNVGVFE